MPDTSPRLQDPFIGKQINNLRLTQQVGKGGFGAVYRAEHTTLETLYAVKVLNLHLHQDAQALLRFQREAKAMARLHHDNVAQVFDFGQWDNCHYLVMEFLDGETLLERMLAQPTLLTLDQIAPIMGQTCDALGYIHEQGIVHRDLKPSNIFLLQTPDGRDRVKLIDFGIAQLADDLTLTQSGMCMGSPKYMAPEQAEGRIDQIDQRTDLYALATILYQLLTGELPITGNNFASTVYHKINTPPAPLSQTAPHIQWHPQLEALFVQALAKSPQDRYPDLNAFWQSAQQALVAHTKQHLPSQPWLPPSPPAYAQIPPKLSSPQSIHSLITHLPQAPSTELSGALSPLSAMAQDTPSTPIPTPLSASKLAYATAQKDHTTGMQGERPEPSEDRHLPNQSAPPFKMSSLRLYALLALFAAGTFGLGIFFVVKLFGPSTTPQPRPLSPGQLSQQHGIALPSQPTHKRPSQLPKLPPTSTKKSTPAVQPTPARQPAQTAPAVPAPQPMQRVQPVPVPPPQPVARTFQAPRRAAPRSGRRRTYRRKRRVQLRLTSQPSGAIIWRGKQRLGQTPYLLRGRPGQRLTLQLKAPEHKTYKLTLRLTRQLRQRRYIRLKRAPQLFKIKPDLTFE